MILAFFPRSVPAIHRAQIIVFIYHMVFHFREHGARTRQTTRPTDAFVRAVPNICVVWDLVDALAHAACRLPDVRPPIVAVGVLAARTEVGV
tara:strand:- start:269 stop:544 length:276 start_codon:yes stop_codon:yes gene_type:complete